MKPIKKAVFPVAGLGSRFLPATKASMAVAPINIYAKLDADVRVRLDKEVQTAITQNPDLF